MPDRPPAARHRGGSGRPGTSQAGRQGRGGRGRGGQGPGPRKGQSRTDAGRGGADPRRVAFDVLRAVDERDAYANLLLPATLRERGLDRRDAALATELTYGTLRGRGRYDEILRACSDRALADIDPPMLDALRLGAHQLLATRIPAHAAVAETVSLARAVLGAGLARFANAVLRKVSTRDLEQWLAIVAPDREADQVGHLAVTTSHPRWIVTAVLDAVGGDPARAAGVLAAHNTPAEVTLAALPGRCEPAELAGQAGAVPAAYSPRAAYLREGDPAAIRAVRDGRAVVQDEGSQLVALALADAGVEGPDGAWLDLCAGPGGKAALLAGLAGQRGARLVASDLREHRARLVSDAAGAGANVVVADGTAPPWRPGTFDRVLVDVPCTGLGALRRRPELRWRRTPADLAAMRPLQRDLLRAALDAARPGGVVAYATCSPHLAETRVVVDDVLSGRADVVALEAREALPDIPDPGAGPYVQLWPDRHGTDAMFLALLRKQP